MLTAFHTMWEAEAVVRHTTFFTRREPVARRLLIAATRYGGDRMLPAKQCMVRRRLEGRLFSSV